MRLYREKALPTFRCGALRLYSEPGELEGDFRARVDHAIREKRELEMEKLRKRYAPKLARMAERIRKAEQKVEKEETQYAQAKSSSWISIGTTILGAIFGRKAASVGTASRAGTAARGMGRAGKEKEDVERAEADAKARKIDLEALEADFAEAITALKEKIAPESYEVEMTPLRPRKSDIAIEPVVLAWTPWFLDETGMAAPAFRVEA